MGESETLHILKHAILLEKRGKLFYKSVAKQSENDDVREFFEMMSAEEDKHLNILMEQYKYYREKGHFARGQFVASETSKVAPVIMSLDIQGKISAAGYEAAAIEAAIAMEKRAVKLYSESAVTSSDPEEKELYRWLAKWEQSHLDMLTSIDRELLEKVWFDNSFWPF
jgi:rubrerythrin